MDNKLQMLAQMLMGKPSNPQPMGMVGNAAQAMQSRPYQLHVQEAQAMGQTPMTPQQFAAQQSGQ